MAKRVLPGGSMVKGLFTSSEGMIPLMAKQDQISNNLANIRTTGYKKSELLTKTFTRFLENDQGEPFVNDRVTIDEVRIDFTPGPMNRTDNPLDVAIEGDGFFMVETSQGRRFTRNGSFSIDREGRLVTSQGLPLIGKNKEGSDEIIRIKGNNVSVLSDGTVLSNGEEAGVLRVVTFNKPYSLDREGDSLFRPHAGNISMFDSTDFKLHQGFLEMSNADPVESMVDMISLLRIYEANQKAIWAHNETLGKAVNEIGRLNA